MARGGLSLARLGSYERPITARPSFDPYQKSGLSADFEDFLRTLKAVHDATDLRSAIDGAAELLSGEQRHAAESIASRRDMHPEACLSQVHAITELRRSLRPRLEEGHGSAPLLYLDISLAAAARLAVERRVSGETPSRAALPQLVERMLKNALLSDGDGEFDCCAADLAEILRADDLPEAELRELAVVERAARVLRRSSQAQVKLLERWARPLGEKLAIEDWVLEAFGEEVVRGQLIFGLAVLLEALLPRLRERAGHGAWQVASRGRGVARGRLVLARQLEAFERAGRTGPWILLVDELRGEDDIPADVEALVTREAPNLLSHVAIRARNSQVLLVSCAEPERLTPLRALDGRLVSVTLRGEDDVAFEAIRGDSLGGLEGLEGTVEPCDAPVAVRRVGRSDSWVLEERDFTPELVGEKSRNLAALRGKIPSRFDLPVSLALPFGSFERVLECEQNEGVRRCLQELEQRGVSLFEPGADERERKQLLARLRDACAGLRAPPALEQEFRARLEQSALGPAPSWDRAWRCIIRVWASRWNDRAASSRRAAGIAEADVSLAVLVQRALAADYAFVVHTAEPVAEGADEARPGPGCIHVEIVPGLGETLVGNAPGSALVALLDRASGEAHVRAYPSKSVGLFGAGGLLFRSDSNAEDLERYAGAGLYESVPLEPPVPRLLRYAEERLLSDARYRRAVFDQIRELSLAVEEALGGRAQDIEGVIIGDRLTVVQARPQVQAGGGASRGERSDPVAPAKHDDQPGAGAKPVSAARSGFASWLRLIRSLI